MTGRRVWQPQPLCCDKSTAAINPFVHRNPACAVERRIGVFVLGQRAYARLINMVGPDLSPRNPYDIAIIDHPRGGMGKLRRYPPHRLSVGIEELLGSKKQS